MLSLLGDAEKFVHIKILFMVLVLVLIAFFGFFPYVYSFFITFDENTVTVYVFSFVRNLLFGRLLFA